MLKILCPELIQFTGHSVVVLLVRFTKVKVITADVLNMWYVRIDNGHMRSRWHQNGCRTKDMK